MEEPLSIIVVDDEDSMRRRCVKLLSRQGYQVVGASESKAALELMQAKQFDVILVDIRMPGMDGIELMEKVKKRDPSLDAIVMTGYASINTAVKSIKKGAYDYLAKPFDSEKLLHVVDNLKEKRRAQQEISKLRSELEMQRDRPTVVGTPQFIDRVYRFIEKVASVDCNLLILGESGTGKGLLAKLIHYNSERAECPFVVADCAALAPSVLEDELFGHVKGAFTDAYASRRGYFETAESGTLFLDEIGELPLKLQARLLRAVQDQTIIKIGDTKPVKVDVRLLAATNRDLEAMVAEGSFRKDLLYRLNVISFRMPPLREHPEDISVLIDHFLKYYAARLNLPRVSKEAVEYLRSYKNYDWPGNVRELENAVQRALVIGHERPGPDISAGPAAGQDAIELSVDPNSDLGYQDLVRSVVSDFSRQYLERLLCKNQGNITHMSHDLGMRRTSAQRLVKRHGLDPKKYRP